MTIFSPWVILGFLLAMGTAFSGGYFKGKDAEYQRQQIEIAALNAKARETEQAMAQVAQTYGEQLRKANNVAKAKENQLRSSLADGSVKLRVPVKTNCPIPVSESTATPSGSDAGTASAELDRQASETLIAIAAEGDAAIRKLNTCIQTYETLRNTK